jgi:sterol desaturase/sphingolipid hydroxylase (fatty acid hydroxylase superfamily)
VTAASAIRAGESTGRLVFARAIFPIVMLGSLTSAFALIERGWKPGAAAITAQIAGILVVIVCERLLPHHASWNRSRGDVRVDAAHAVTIITAGALAMPVITYLGIGLYDLARPVVDIGIWPIGWPLWGQLALSLVVVEFFQYWVHRFQHTTDWLWRFHATHHSAPRLYWLNASRFHFVDILLLNFAGYVPLVALGAGTDVFALWILFSSVHGVFQHANVPLRLGPLNWIFSMAELHRWHHSPDLRAASHNFGQNLILWDIVFGTRWLPSDREPPEAIGIDGLPAFPMTYAAQLASPLHWKEIEASSRSQDAPR